MKFLQSLLPLIIIDLTYAGLPTRESDVKKFLKRSASTKSSNSNVIAESNFDYNFVDESTVDTEDVTLLSDTEVTKVLDKIKAGEPIKVESDLKMKKYRNDSAGYVDYIKYIDLSESKVKTWTANSGYEDDMEIKYGYGPDPTKLECRDNSGRCFPFHDTRQNPEKSNSVVLIGFRFAPRRGYAHHTHGHWARNRYTLLGTYYKVSVEESTMLLSDTEVTKVLDKIKAGEKWRCMKIA